MAPKRKGHVSQAPRKKRVSEICQEVQTGNDEDEEDQLEGPNGWKPSIKDFDHLRTSALIKDLPIPRAGTSVSDQASKGEFEKLVQDFNGLHILPLPQVSFPTSEAAKPPEEKILEFDYIPMDINTSGTSPSADLPDLRYFQGTIRHFLHEHFAIDEKLTLPEWPWQLSSESMVLDLREPPGHPTNANSIRQLVHLYLRLANSSHISYISHVKPRYLTEEFIRNHFITVIKRLHERKTTPQTVIALQTKRRSERRRKLWKRREAHLDVAHLIPGLLKQQIKNLGPDGMSDEESDHDEKGPYLRIRSPLWRHQLLTSALHSLDGHTASFSMRRIRTLEPSTTRHPVLGLAINCYDEEWMEKADKQVVLLVNSKATGAV